LTREVAPSDDPSVLAMSGCEDLGQVVGDETMPEPDVCAVRQTNGYWDAFGRPAAESRRRRRAM